MEELRVKVGETWINIFDNNHAKILEVRHFPKLGGIGVRYVKQSNNKDHLKPLDLFLKTYGKVK